MYKGTLKSLEERGLTNETFSSSNVGCCAFLSYRREPATMFYLSKYQGMNKDTSKTFEEWLTFLKEELKFKFQYKKYSVPVYGSYSCTVANKIITDLAKKVPNKIKIHENKKLEPLATYYDRSNAHFNITRGKVVSNIYNRKLKQYSYNIFMDERGLYYSADNLTNRIYAKEFPSKPVDLYAIELFYPKNKGILNMRLLEWTFIRDFYTNPWLPLYVLKNKDFIKEEILDENFGWFYFYNYLRYMCGTSTFFELFAKRPENTFEEVIAQAEKASKAFNLEEKFKDRQCPIYDTMSLSDHVHEVEVLLNYKFEYHYRNWAPLAYIDEQVKTQSLNNKINRQLSPIKDKTIEMYRNLENGFDVEFSESQSTSLLEGYTLLKKLILNG
jgi:hypothetical protein